jgi:hypothetical protein
MAIISMGLDIEALWGYAYSPPNYLDREVDVLILVHDIIYFV